MPEGWAYACPQKLSGNMPAVRERPRYIPGVTISILQMPTINGVGSSRQLMLVNMLPIHGAFLICMGMYGSGLLIGTKFRIQTLIQ